MGLWVLLHFLPKMALLLMIIQFSPTLIEQSCQFCRTLLTTVTNDDINAYLIFVSPRGTQNILTENALLDVQRAKILTLMAINQTKEQWQVILTSRLSSGNINMIVHARADKNC